MSAVNRIPGGGKKDFSKVLLYSETLCIGGNGEQGCGSQARSFALEFHVCIGRFNGISHIQHHPESWLWQILQYLSLEEKMSP